MGRALYFYEFSSSTWRAHVGSQDDATRRYLLTTIDSVGAPLDRRVINAVMEGALDAELAGLESGDYIWVARVLVSLGQRPVPAPSAESFWYSLSQTSLSGGSVESTPLATSGVEQRVLRYLRAGRPLIGDGFVGEGVRALSNVYGWLDAGDETDALAKIITAPAWGAYPLQNRYRKKWNGEQGIAHAWAAALGAAGKDIFFTSEPLPEP